MQKRGLLPNGTTLAGDRYRIQRHIASGGFGNTYYAVDTTFDEPVVIKELFIKGICGRQDDTTEVTVTLRENKSTFDAHRDKFRKEARRLRRLSNVHIVGVHDLFDENGTSYYVMDFIDGESLASLIKRRGVMSEAEVRGLLPGMLDALKAVHAHNIWHLDIKPGNILVNKAGVPMLIDFGASKHVHSNDANSVSMSSGMAYTMGYAPTEQMEQDPNKFGPWTDLYSLGATLYKLLTNSQIPSPSSIAESGRDALPFPLGISPQMQDLILWLMQPMRTKRPQSVDEVEAWIADKLGDTGDTAVVIPEDDIIPASAIEVLPDEELFETPYVAPPVQPIAPVEQPVAPVAQPIVHEEKPVERISTQAPKQKKEDIPAKAVPEKKPKVTIVEEPDKKTGDKKGLYLFIAVFVVAIVAIFLIRNYSSGLWNGQQDSPEIQTVTQVTDMEVYVDDAPENMREFTYTGELSIADSLPSGHGVAKFPGHGDTSAATYTGNFVDGKCTDDTGSANIVFEDGDSFTGTFSDGYYVKGKYTLSDGSYFEGEFKDGAQYNGTLYDVNGAAKITYKDGEVTQAKV